MQADRPMPRRSAARTGERLTVQPGDYAPRDARAVRYLRHDGSLLLQRAGVPAGKVQDAGDLMVDPQLVDRGLWRTCDHGVFGERPYDRFPALWSHMDLEPYVPPPSYVGEHNFEVFEELAGMDVGEIAEGMGDGLFS